VKTNEEWMKAGENKQPAWCYYDNDPKNGKKYGKLYNWYAVSDPRGLAPEGWHIPSRQEIDSFEEFLGGPVTENNDKRMFEISIKLQSKTDWLYGCKHCINKKNEFDCAVCEGVLDKSSMPLPGIGNNKSGFSALPGGGRSLGYYGGIGKGAGWWLSTESSDDGCQCGGPDEILINQNTFIMYFSTDVTQGNSVRCIKD
jgi:uncharacterized protein (TIGR02145 family)